MKLKLEAFALNDQPLSQPLCATFDDEGGTIGRADQNTLTLPDPRRHISRHQALVSSDASGFIIRNIGSANPISVRGQVLACDASMKLTEGDQLRIGGYTLRAANGPVANAPESGDNAGEPSGFDTRDPGLDAIGASPAAASPPPAWPPTTPPWRPPARPAPTTALIPEDFDPFAEPSRTRKTFPAHVPRSTDAPFADLVPTVAPASLDALFGLDQPIDDVLANFTRGELDPQDAPAALAPDTFMGRPEADRTSSLRSVFTPPALVSQEVRDIDTRFPSREPPVTQPAPAPLDLTWWTAFCEGAGISPGLNPTPTPLQLRHAGAALRETLQGLTRLLQACDTGAPAPGDGSIEAALQTLWTADDGDLHRAPGMIARAFEEFVVSPQGAVAGHA